jgi:hypothetical protein
MRAQNPRQVSLHADEERQEQLRAEQPVQRTLVAANVRRLIVYSLVLGVVLGRTSE